MLCPARILHAIHGSSAWIQFHVIIRRHHSASCFLALNFGEGTAHPSQLTNLIFPERSNSGYLTWFGHNIAREEAQPSAMWIDRTDGLSDWSYLGADVGVVLGKNMPTLVAWCIVCPRCPYRKSLPKDRWPEMCWNVSGTGILRFRLASPMLHAQSPWCYLLLGNVAYSWLAAKEQIIWVDLVLLATCLLILWRWKMCVQTAWHWQMEMCRCLLVVSR